MAKATFGKNAKIRIAKITLALIAADGKATKPPTNSFVDFCLPREVTIGSEYGTIDIENFCTNGNTISVRDGTRTGTLDLGETNWVRDDPAIQIMRACANESEQGGGQAWFEVLPEGDIQGGLAYDFQVEVKGWSMKIPAKGFITATYTLNVLEGPNESEIGVTNPGGQAVTLTSGTAVTGIDGAAGEISIYTITLTDPGTLTVAVSGGTGDVQVSVKDVNGAILGSSNVPSSNAESVKLVNLPAGTYAIEITSKTAYSGVSLTATVS